MPWMPRLQDLIDKDPGRSTRFFVRELNISEYAVRKKMAQDIHYNSYSL